jgi:hypothetical protein
MLSFRRVVSEGGREGGREGKREGRSRKGKGCIFVREYAEKGTERPPACPPPIADALFVSVKAFANRNLKT